MAAAAALHDEVASAIGRQVEQTILQAKQDSEARVAHEFERVRSMMEEMDRQINSLSDRVQTTCKSTGPQDMSNAVDRQSLTQALQALEARWGAEMKSLKQDLHRTILAHNHNSDLLKDHKEALDEVRRKIELQTSPSMGQIDQQLAKVDWMLRNSQVKQRTIDALFERLDQLEAAVNEVCPASPGMGGYPTVAADGKSKASAPRPPPTDEEVQRRLLGKAGGGGGQLSAEAPVFIPQ